MESIKHPEQTCGARGVEQEESESLPARFLLVLQAYLSLIRFDVYLARGKFAPLYNKVRNYPISKRRVSKDSVRVICAAVDLACIWYWKEVLCLQRSAATVCLLRKYGVLGHLVIGAQQLPFKSHAWVEVDNTAVNDKHYVTEMFGVLTKC